MEIHKINIGFPIYFYKNQPFDYDHPTKIKDFPNKGTVSRLIGSIQKNLPDNFRVDIFIILGKSKKEGLSNEEIERLTIQVIKEKIRKDKRINFYILGNRAFKELKKTKSDLIIDNRGYGNIRNLLLITQVIFNLPFLVNLDDDEIIKNREFFFQVKKIEEKIKRKRNLGGIGGLCVNQKLSPSISRVRKINPRMNIFTQRKIIQQQLIEKFTKEKWTFPAGVVFGGINVIKKDIAKNVCYDPYILRGEDIDFILNAYFRGYSFGVLSNFNVIHRPPKLSSAQEKSKLLKDILRFLYEKRKIEIMSQRYKIPLNKIYTLTQPYPAFFLERDKKELLKEASAYIKKEDLERRIRYHFPYEIKKFIRMYEDWPFYIKKEIIPKKNIKNLLVKI